MGNSAHIYGMREVGTQRASAGGAARPYPAPTDRSTAYIVLSVAEAALAGVFAAIPLFWSIQYKRAVLSDPDTPLRKTAMSALVMIAAAGGAVNAAATLLALLA